MIEKELNMKSIKILIFINLTIGLFLPMSQAFSNSLDEVICSAMKGMVNQESKKIPFKVDEYLVVGLSVDCEKKTLITEKKHITLQKTEFKINFKEISQENWEKTNCSNMIFNTDTGWSTEQLVKDKEGVLVSRVRANFSHCSK